MSTTAIDYNIPLELTTIMNSDCIIQREWEQVTKLIHPFPEQHMILSTSAPNNTIILATKLYELLSIKLNEFI